MVQSLYELIDGPDCPFEAVLWASLRTEHLTEEGVELIRDAAHTIEDAAVRMGKGIGLESDGSPARTIADLLEGTPALLVVDNVETADSNEVIAFIEAMPLSCRFLQTSRVGLGQLERRVDRATSLVPQFASFLFRQIGRRVRELDHAKSNV